MPSCSGHRAAGSAFASALCTPTWNMRGVKRSMSTPDTIIRAGVRFAHADQEPRALGGPVDRIDVPRSGGPSKQGVAQRDMCPARRDRRLHAPQQGAEEGAARSTPRDGAEPDSCRIEAPHDARVPAGMIGIFDRRRRRLQSTPRSDSSDKPGLAFARLCRKGGRRPALGFRAAPAQEMRSAPVDCGCAGATC